MPERAAGYRLDDLPPNFRKNVIVNPVTNCWEWQGQINAQGYGRVTRNGVHQQVHRIVYALLVEPIPPGLDIDHVQDRGCRSRACCWPAHLEPVTHAENSRRGAEWITKRRHAALAQMAVGSSIRQVTASRAHQGFNRILNEVENRGEHVEILRYITPAAVLVPVEWYGRARQALGLTDITEQGEQ